ncbi:MAG: hypothetical protein M0036_17330 [Desulfobacteraceae bacterium]|nr:hypothetical protein [Desulfobacteraceae bacterium]
MTFAKLFINDFQQFSECKANLERSCHIEKQFPAQVFMKKFNRFVFEEFDWAMSEKCWSTLQDLARKSGDKSLIISVLEPDPVDYYKKTFGCYNWAIISSSCTSDEYWMLLNHHPEESPADSMLSNSERVVWAARSGAWALWGERSLEICVLACSEINVGEFATWHDVDWVLYDILPGRFRDRVVPAEFIKQFRENYGG